MPRAAFLAQLGWFVVPRFLDAATCAGIRREIQQSTCQPATILNDRHEVVVDTNTRRTEIAAVSDSTRATISDRLMHVLPALEKHFNVSLAGCEPPSFLVYKPGFHFEPHSDANDNPDAPIKFQSRRVSISIYLNSESEDSTADTYSGGALRFCGAKKNNHDNHYLGLAVTGEEGLLIGFDSRWIHEVQPVRRGVRYSIVTWFA